MKNYVQEGCHLDLTAPHDLTSGEGFVVGAIFAVASTAAASGAAVVGVTEGVFDLPKRASATFSSGGLVSYDISEKRCDTPGTGFYPIGAATTAAGSGATTVRVKLAEVPTVAAS